MPREQAIRQLNEATQITIPAIIGNFKINDKFLDDKALTNQIFLLAQQNKPYVTELEEYGDTEALTVVSNYNEAMRTAVMHMESVRKNNRNLIPQDIPAEILSHIQKDDAVLLDNLLKRCEQAPNILNHYNYALRVAACGSIKCLNYLLETECPDIKNPGPKSGKIAMHSAIENGRLDCVTALLKAKNTLDFYEPAGQLLYGKEPKRPIDCLQNLKDQEKAVQIERAILAVFKTEAGQGAMTSQSQITTIKQIIEENQAQRNRMQLGVM